MRLSRPGAVALMVVAGVAMAGCGSTASAPAPTVSTSAESLSLPASITVGIQTVLLEVARTPQQQATGLKFRTSLSPERGMVFPVQPERVVSLWMKDTLIPLDMVFVRNGKVVKVAANIPPCTTDPCAHYSSETPVDQVVELKAGRAAELGIKTGQPLQVNFT